MRSSIAVAAMAATASAAGRPANESICDYYTTALLKNNTAANQQTLLTLVVNTAVIGNYTTPNVGVAVPGILNPGTYKGTKVNLLPYFNGALASTNNGGSSGVSMNFLDGGGAAPLMKNLPADNTSSAQYTLLTHLYEYFAVLLGCSMYGSSVTPYAGQTSLYGVHKYMALDEAQFMYFVTQVGLSAASFGVAASDVEDVGKALVDAFGYRCSPPEAIPTTASAQLQAICIDSDCPMATASADCSAYSSVVMPTTVAMTSSMSSSMESSMMSSMSTMAPNATAPMSTMSVPTGTSPATMSSMSASSMPTSVMPQNSGMSLMPALTGLVGAFVAVLALA